MYRFALLALTAFALLLVAPISLKPAYGKTYNLRYSDIGPPRGPRANALIWWAKELEKRSNGEIKIKFYWSQSLVKGKETLKAVGSGLSEMGSIIGVYTPADVPIWNYANAPFAIGDAWVGMRTWWELRQKLPELDEETNKRKVKILLNFTTGPVQLLSAKRPMTTVADLKGAKIRTTGGWTHMFKELGAVPVKVGFGELYAALDRGTIDGTINYTSFVKSYKHYEVASHVTEANMGQLLGYGAGINLRLFNEMPKEIQDILVKTSDEYMDVYARMSIEAAEKDTADMIAGIDGKKVQFHTLAPTERERWAAKAAAFTTSWIAKMDKQGVDANKIIAAFEATRAKYRKELKEKGYPWTR